MQIPIDVNSMRDYRTFLKVRRLPTYAFRGEFAEFPDEYANMIGEDAAAAKEIDYRPSDFLMDYQRDIVGICLRRKKFCVFADCGLGKTLVFLEYAKHVEGVLPAGKAILIVSPLMVVKQTIAECKRFYGDTLRIDTVPSGGVGEWLKNGEGRIGITNYEAFTNPIDRGRLGALIVDESSMLKSHYGKWGTSIVRIGRGVEWKLCLTGTPAPNDRIEFANHAVLMDAFPSVNSFLARYFINRGQTDNRWELKPHATQPFYRDLSHWCIFLANPKTYGWHDNTETLPPIEVYIHDVDMTTEQRDAVQSKTGTLFACTPGGIVSRTRLATIAKGYDGKIKVATKKMDYISDLVRSWPDESTIVWCLYNEEQRLLEKALPLAESMDGSTSFDERERIIEDFKARRCRVLIAKPKLLGFGLNLQVATRQVFSGLQDSYESFYQAVKRSNRFGSTHPLRVHIPITEIERPMVDTVLAKAHRVQQDAEQIERVFKDATPFWRTVANS